jgi:hypothetical protein
MKNWTYNGGNEITSINDLPKDAFGFIYQTTHLPTGKKYIGKKSLMYKNKKKLTKKELAEQTGPGRKPTHKIVFKESDWKTYFGSHQFIKEQVKINADQFERKILAIAYDKKELTYLECKFQFSLSVLESDEWLNDNILGKFFDKDFK